jgi:hypothetical protein
MSTPTSSAHEGAARIRRAVARKLASGPAPGDPAMGALKSATVGGPVLARSPEGEPAFWLVSLELGHRACGFARADLAERVVQISSFGPGPESWPEAALFSHPPGRVIEEVRGLHPGAELGPATLSYDGSPAKWAWRMTVGNPATAVVFMTPGGWYERPPLPAPEDAREA